jgi:ATP-dependent Clp protease ATP-binding subunit ClpC
MLDAAKRAFLPEFMNRIDEVVVFDALTEEQVARIGGLICSRLADRLRTERGIELTVDPALVGRLAAEGFDPEFGARPLKRHIRRTLEAELTGAILDGRISPGDSVHATEAADGGIALTVSAPATV